MKRIAIVALISATPWVIFAQEQQTTTPSQEPAVTKKDLKDSLQPLGKKADRLSQLVHENAAREEKAEQKQSLSNAQQLAAQNRLEAQGQTTQAIVEENTRKLRRTIEMSVGALALVVFGAIVLWGLWIQRTKKRLRPAEIVSIRERAELPIRPLRIINPDIPTLLKMREETGLSRFPITLKPEANDRFTEKIPVDCEAAFLGSSSRPVVYFPGEEDLISWEKAMKHAVKITERITKVG
jgi:hypothetical protein